MTGFEMITGAMYAAPTRQARTALFDRLQNEVKNCHLNDDVKKAISDDLTRRYDTIVAEMEVVDKIREERKVESHPFAIATEADMCCASILDVISTSKEETLQKSIDQFNKRILTINKAAIDNHTTTTITNVDGNADDSAEAVIVIDKKIYENNLPDGITPDTLKQLKEYNDDYKAGILLATGHIAFDAIKKEPNIEYIRSFAPYLDQQIVSTTVLSNIRHDCAGVPFIDEYPEPGDPLKQYLFEQKIKDSVTTIQERENAKDNIITYLNNLYLLEMSK